jgi:hypothetical protein
MPEHCSRVTRLTLDVMQISDILGKRRALEPSGRLLAGAGVGCRRMSDVKREMVDGDSGAGRRRADRG